MIECLPEEQRHHAGVRRVNELAFGNPAEANLVDQLRASGKAVLSAVATEDEEVIGHILFSPITIEREGAGVAGLGLAPMAVRPDRQQQGVGSHLVRWSLEHCRAAGHERVVVLGHPDYYPRFGFRPASRFGLRCEFEAPDEAFMALALCDEALADCAGLVRYAAEFKEVGR